MTVKKGRPKSENPKNKRFDIRLTDSEFLKLKKLSNKLKLNRTQIIVKAINFLDENTK